MAISALRSATRLALAAATACCCSGVTPDERDA
jgi:hypothetical protein